MTRLLKSMLTNSVNSISLIFKENLTFRHINLLIACSIICLEKYIKKDVDKKVIMKKVVMRSVIAVAIVLVLIASYLVYNKIMFDKRFAVEYDHCIKEVFSEYYTGLAEQKKDVSWCSRVEASDRNWCEAVAGNDSAKCNAVNALDQNVCKAKVSGDVSWCNKDTLCELQVTKDKKKCLEVHDKDFCTFFLDAPVLSESLPADFGKEGCKQEALLKAKSSQ